jgi:uncharacterized membrane protein YqiK
MNPGLEGGADGGAEEERRRAEREELKARLKAEAERAKAEKEEEAQRAREEQEKRRAEEKEAEEAKEKERLDAVAREASPELAEKIVRMRRQVEGARRAVQNREQGVQPGQYTLGDELQYQALSNDLRKWVVQIDEMSARLRKGGREQESPPGAIEPAPI